MDLRKFTKPSQSKLSQATSIKITDKQAEFIRENNLNLSALVRDLLDKLIAQSKHNDLINRKDG